MFPYQFRLACWPHVFFGWLLLSHFVLSVKVRTQTISGLSFDPEIRMDLMVYHLS